MKSIVNWLKHSSAILWNGYQKLSKREKNILIVTIAVFTALGVDFSCVSPLRRNNEDLAKKISVHEKKVAHNIHTIEQSPAVDEEFSRLQNIIEMSKGNDEQVSASMLDEIGQFARSKNIYVIEKKPQSSDQKQNYKEYRVRVQMEGTLQDLLSFFAELVRTKKLYFVDSLRIVAHPEDINKIKATATLSRLILQSQLS